MKTLETRLPIESWDENTYKEIDGGRRLTRADVGLGAADGIDSATFVSLLLYRADGTSEYVSQMHIDGTLDGRSGSFVLHGSGSYDGTTAFGEYQVVADSATGELAGLTGTLVSSSTHADYPNMPLTLTYALG